MLKATCDHCGKEGDIRILPSVLVLAQSVESVKADVEAAIADPSAKRRHELVMPNGWVTACRMIPEDDGPALAWTACSQEHAERLEAEMRAQGKWETPDGNVPIERKFGPTDWQEKFSKGGDIQ